MQKIKDAEFEQRIATWAVIIDYYAERCPPCKMLAPMLENVQQQLEGRLSIYKVDVDEEFALAAKQGITGMPTLQFYKDWALIETVIWLDPPRITNAIDKILQ